MMIYNNDFDLSIVWLIRKMIANFIEKNPQKSFNGLPIEYAFEETDDVNNLNDYV